MKTSQGECLFYIYNYVHIAPRWESILKKWNAVLAQHGLKIKVMFTKNADPSNHDKSAVQYEFLPLCQTDVWETFSTPTGLIPVHYEIDYHKLLDKIAQSTTSRHDHLGLALHWNNSIRKKNTPHLHILHFSKENLEKMLLVLLSKIILRHQDRYTSSNIPKYKITSVPNPESDFYLEDNIIIVNAWNEWNEQAILEPNNRTGFENLETIHRIMTSL
jgi:hypothetical protein